MATSLAAQLKKLRTPQTDLLSQDVQRSSFLFDLQEARNLDRDTILSIGQSGLQELVKISTLFDSFKTTLFAKSSLNFERAIQDVTVNKKLDAEITRFLLLLSPYFLLNATHKALEWLVYRYQVHQYNRDQFMLLILPYHKTHMFVRALYLVDLSDEGDKWHWLKPLQKRGVPLASGTLVNRLSSDNGFLKMLCTHIISATEAYTNQHASCLSCLYAFYTTVVLGMIEQASITEVQINHLLPTLLRGLKSPILDFAASSYMIFAKSMTKVKFNDDTIEKLLLKTFKKTHLQQEAVVLLLYLYQAPVNRLTVVPRSLILQLSNLTWFVEMIAKVHSSGTNASRFVVSFLQAACQLIAKHDEDTSNIQNMINDLIIRVKLDDVAIDAILSGVLTSGSLKTDISQTAKDFLARFYQNFERSYPERFDAYLRKLMKHGKDDENSKQVLQFLTSRPFDTEVTYSVEILNKLTHFNAVQRTMALEMLAKENVNISENFRDIMTSVLQARFHDNDVNVVKTLLSFSTERLTSLLPIDTLVDDLLILLSTCHISSRKILAKPAVKILLEFCKSSDDTNVFITALPYLFPATDDDVEIAMEVLHSKFAKNNLYMQQVMRDVSKCDLLNADVVSSAAFHSILNYELLPPTEDILISMRQRISHGDAASLFFNMILLGSVCRVPVGSMPAKIARDVIEIATEMIKIYPCVKLLQDCNNITGDNIQTALALTSQGILPLQVGTYVLEMVHRRLNIKSDPRLDFEGNAERSNLILRMLEIFIEGMDNQHWKKHYSRCLQIFFQLHFSTIKDLICFLAQFYIRPVKVQTSYHCLQITLLLLEQCNSVQWAFEDQDLVTNLLLVLMHRNNDCRAIALEILKKLTSTFSLSTAPFVMLLKELAAKSAEISQDPDQLSVSLYILLSPDPDVSQQIKQREKLQQAQQLLFDMVMQQNKTSITLDRRSQLLDILIHVNSTGILKQLAPLGLQLLQMLAEDTSNRSAGSMLQNILQRFNTITVDALNDEQVWMLFEKSILEYELQVITKSEQQIFPSVILLKQIDERLFEKAGALRPRILAKILDVVTDCEISAVINVASRTIRRIHIDATIVVSELEIMKKASQEKESVTENTRKRKRRQSMIRVANPVMVHSRAWKRGVMLLEFVQNADNIEREELLYGVLFDLLNVCLSLEVQNPIEYTNQLILSTIHRLMTSGLPMRDVDLQIPLITRCIRTSRNPQTHHHALLVLVELLKKADVRRALFNIMPIFTFMGSTMVRQDDAYSIQIITKTLETVVPIVNAADDEIHACEVLRTFIVSLPHIPEHRRTSLFIKLLQLLDNHLHLYYLLTFESQAMKITNQKTEQPVQLDFAVQVSQEFSPQQLLQICMKLAEFVKILPSDIEDEQGKKAAMKFPYKHIYDVTNTTPKALRHYKITAAQFLSKLLSSQDFINRVALLNQNEMSEMNKYCNQFVIELILLIQNTSRIADQHQNKSNAKYWKVLLHHFYDVLDLVNNLLPNAPFLTSIKNLMKHELLSVRKKALELLNARLIQKKFNEEDHIELLSLIESLMDFIDIHTKSESQEEEIVQQTALISLKLLAKLLATNHSVIFKPVLDMTTELLRSKDGPVLASAALCVAELCTSMKIYSLHSLNKFMPVILNLLKSHCHQAMPDITAISIVSALQKIVESLGNFLSLYLDQFLFELARLNSLYTDKEQPKIGLVVSRLKMITQKLCSCVPLRVVLPAVNRIYQILLSKKFYQYIPSLMDLLAESFNNVQSTELKTEINNLAKFFLEVFQFREDVENDMKIDDGNDILKDVVAAEESTSKALVTLVLKLSEVTFEPLYSKLYDWAANNPQHKQRNITFYRLSANIAECLKSLFVLFAGNFLKHAALLLSNNNMFVTNMPQELTLLDEPSRIELVEAILLTLHRVFDYDAHNFVSQDRFEILAQPIVDQVENTMGTQEDYEARASRLIVPCIASFVSAIPDDSLHKQLVYQILLKTRHAKPYVRSTALNALVEIARKLGEDFMSLLPETVPFLAELLEDEDEATEKCAQNAVRTLEEILGEPLQKYF